VEVRPFDPRDIFFGHYARLNYFGTTVQVPPAWRKDADNRFSGTTVPDDGVLVISEGEAGIYRPVRYATSAEPLSADERVIRLKHDGTGGQFLNADLPDRHYADETTALALEDAIRDSARRVREAEVRAIELERAAAQAEGRAPDIDAARRQAADALVADDVFAILALHRDGSTRLKGLIIEGEEYRDSLWTGQRLARTFREREDAASEDG